MLFSIKLVKLKKVCLAQILGVKLAEGVLLALVISEGKKTLLGYSS